MFLFIKYSVVLRVLGIVCKGYICIFSQSLLLSAFLFFVHFYSLYISILHTLLFFVHFFSFVHVYALYICILSAFLFLYISTLRTTISYVMSGIVHFCGEDSCTGGT